MRKERFRKVIDFVKQIPEENFDMRSITNIWNENKDPSKLLREHTCGSTGCVVGYFPLIFPEDFEYTDMLPAGTKSPLYHIRMKEDQYDVNNVEDFLEISKEECDILFFGDNIENSDEVRERNKQQQIDFMEEFFKNKTENN